MLKEKGLSRYIGDRNFYSRLARVCLPIMLQNGITNLVSLLDNIMVGAVGTEQMSGVSIVNQLLFVFNLCIFGGLSGAGIFTAQFFGSEDEEGVRNTFRFKFLLAMSLFAAGLVVFSLSGERLIALYLHEGGETGDGFGTEILMTNVALHAVVDFASRLRLFHVIGEAEVLPQHQLEIALGVGAHELDAQLVCPRFLPALP